MKHGEVRIIGGQWRSRKLKFPAVPGLRPTADRVRETLFNWLAPHIQGAYCLDLFAGSGALGFEALSRGASFVTFCDDNPLIIKYLKEQIILLGTDHASVYRAKMPIDVPLSQKIDIAFLDPPFHKNLIQPSCKWLEQKDCLAENALIYIEAENNLLPLPIPDHWETLHSRISGQTGYHLIRLAKK